MVCSEHCCLITPQPQIEKRLEPVQPEEGKDSKDSVDNPKLGCTIFLGYTSNLISSGVRESIRYLAQHKMVHVKPCFLTLKLQVTFHTTGGRVYQNSCCFSVLGGCDCNHSRRHRGGFNQMYGPHVPGRLQPAGQGPPPEGHQQVSKHWYNSVHKNGVSFFNWEDKNVCLHLICQTTFLSAKVS